MNTNLFKKIGIIALVVVIAAPQLSFAAGPLVERRANKTKPTGESFCTSINSRSNQWNAKIDTKTAELNIRRNEQANKKLQNRADRDTKLETHRDGWDDNRNARFTKLETKAVSDEQKAAVAEFKITVTTAITTRRTAIDAAIAAFRTGMNGINTANKTAIDAAIVNFKTAYQTAATKAVADCAAGIDAKTAKATFDTSVKAAAETFKTVKDSINKKPEVQTLIEARKIAVNKAITDFKTTLQTAQQKLQLVFPKK